MKKSTWPKIGRKKKSEQGTKINERVKMREQERKIELLITSLSKKV
jgi:hypothetical protein